MNGKTSPSKDELGRAAALIRYGKLVAFPTETVYGLGANALDPAAVERIFAAKGRPITSPLIVHVASVEMARTLVRLWPESAERLARRFWPGPLTLVLPKHHKIPEIVTAGLDTVGIRIPNHPLALSLIQEAGVPIAAPSANRFTQLSPTTAGHVRDGLGDAVDMILDGGPTEVGIESTVLSLGAAEPTLLRPGMISITQIEEVIGEVASAGDIHGAHPSPGMHKKHYSPLTPLILVSGGEALPQGKGAYLPIGGGVPSGNCIPMPGDPARYGAALYETLHRLDRGQFDWIAIQRPPGGAEWDGIRDRLERAARK